MDGSLGATYYDAALVIRLRERDEAVFADLVRRWGETMQRVARTHVASDSSAEEVVHRARFRRHVALCPGCNTYVDHPLQTIGTMARLTPDDLDPVARDRLLEVFRVWVVESPAPHRHRRKD